MNCNSSFPLLKDDNLSICHNHSPRTGYSYQASPRIVMLGGQFCTARSSGLRNKIKIKIQIQRHKTKLHSTQLEVAAEAVAAIGNINQLNNAVKTEYFICSRSDYFLLDWEQHGAVQPDPGQGQPGQEEDKDSLPPPGPGRCAGHHVPHGRKEKYI